MAFFVRLWFEGGRLLVEGAGELLGLSLRDPRTRCHVARPSDYASILAAAARRGVAVDDELAALLAAPPPRPSRPPPDPRLLDLLGSLDLYGGSGYIGIPEGKPRVDLVSALLCSAGGATLLLCAGEDGGARWQAALRDFSPGDPEAGLPGGPAVLPLER
jgi:hypothetical protein